MQVKVIVVLIVKFASLKLSVIIIFESSIYLLSRYSLDKLVMVGGPSSPLGTRPTLN